MDLKVIQEAGPMFIPFFLRGKKSKVPPYISVVLGLLLHVVGKWCLWSSCCLIGISSSVYLLILGVRYYLHYSHLSYKFSN